MLELVPVRASVVVCFGSPEGLDRLSPEDGLLHCRLAPDELLLVGGAGRGDDMRDRTATRLADWDRDGLVIEQSGGWSLWCVRGPAVAEVLRRLSVLPIPGERPAFLQGAVAQVPAKVILEEDVLHLLVPAPVGHHLRDRILEACRDLSPRLLEPKEMFPVVTTREDTPDRVAGL